MLVGDFKVKIKNINTSSRQFGAIIEHAKEYGRHVALYISAGGSPRQAQFRIKQAAARKVALILIFPE